MATSTAQDQVVEHRRQEVQQAIDNACDQMRSEGVQPNNYVEARITARGDQELTRKDKLTERYYSDAYTLQGVLNPQNLLTYQDYAQNNYYTAVRAYSQSRYDYLTSLLTLKQQAGRLTRADLQAVDAMLVEVAP